VINAVLPVLVIHDLQTALVDELGKGFYVIQVRAFLTAICFTTSYKHSIYKIIIEIIFK